MFLLLLVKFITAQNVAVDEVGLIPVPVSMQLQAGNFPITAATRIVIEDKAAAHTDVAATFSAMLKTVTGYAITVASSATKTGNIYLRLDDTAEKVLGAEGYRLKVTSAGVQILAAKPAGWFYAVQTVMQLLKSAEINSEKKSLTAKSWRIPCVTIEDFPRFQWRGLMLDVSRHFFSKEVIMAYIAQMAKYKLNTFHFHLTDNQGWRIEVKSMPELTRVGAWRVPRTGYWKGFVAPQPGEAATYGGFYSQDDIREIVRFAASRFVTVVPEIDVPGHSLALIASYPGISCTQTPQQVLAGDPWNAKRTNVLCVGNDSTFLALDKIMTEVAALFPAEYIHIGGDEVSRMYWEKCSRCQQRIKDENLKSVQELQTYFIKRLAKIVESKGKKAMGWYENLDGGLAPGIGVMSWKSYQGGIVGSQAGHKVVMTPAEYTYLDFYQNDPVLENGPFTVARLSTFYQFDPVPDGAVAENILGGQGSLWTEQVPNERKLQYMTWPRGLALAEVLWSPRKNRNWSGFVRRMEARLPDFDAAGVKYATAFYEPMVKAVKDADGSYKIKITTEVNGLRLFYSFDDTSPDPFYPEYKGGLISPPTGAHHIRVVSYRNGKPMGREINIEIAELIKRAGGK